MVDLGNMVALAAVPVLAAALYIMRINRRTNTMSDENPAPTIEDLEREALDVARLQDRIRELRREKDLPKNEKRERIRSLRRQLREERAELADIRKAYNEANRKPVIFFDRLWDQVQLELLRALKLHAPGEAQVDAAVGAVIEKLDQLIEFGPVVEQVTDAGLALFVRPLIRGMAMRALEELEELGENKLEA